MVPMLCRHDRCEHQSRLSLPFFQYPKHRFTHLYIDIAAGIVKERGYVTKDFPFLEESIRNEMESILKTTENYWDFTEKLVTHVDDPNTHPNLIFLALYHASRLRNKKALYQILDAHPKILIPFPFYFSEGNDYYHDRPIIESAIELNKNPVITFYMLMRLFRTSPCGSPEEEEATKLIEKSLADNPQLMLHSADYIGHVGFRLKQTGQPKESFDMMMKALQLARKSGDKWHQASLLTLLGEVAGQYKKGKDTFTDAKKYLEEAVTLCREINDKFGLANALQTMCAFAYSRGELGEAFDCQLESILMQGEIGDVDNVSASNMAGLYLVSGDKESAREWYNTVRAAEDDLGPYALFGDAEYYLSLGKIEEAESVLDRARELTLSLGLETALGRLYRITGDVEVAKGDLESAMDSIQRALEINERASRQLRVRLCLVKLAEIELKMFIPTKMNRDDKFSGPWMERLEREIEENDIPGHYGRFLLFQSELRMLQGRHDEAEDILDSVLEMTDNSGMRFLHRDVLAMKEKWVEEGVLSADALHRLRRK